MADVLLSSDWNKGWSLWYEFEDENKQKKQEQFMSFLSKWDNVIKQFGEEVFKMDEVGIKFIPKDTEIHIPEDLPNVLANLFQSDYGEDRGFSLGIEPLPKEFYHDLYELFKDKNGEVDHGEAWSITVSGLRIEGYGNCQIYFEDGGLLWTVTWYEEN
jgi:hypothetical protein